MYRIYIVEDDPSIAESIGIFLRKWGFEAKAAEDFKDLLPPLLEYAPHLVLMDIGLPYYNGFYWCSLLRRQSDVPVVFLSSASDNMNILTAMNSGGDDFIAKPFDLTVLLAKLRAVLRRSYNSYTPKPLTAMGAQLLTEEACLKFGDVRLELTKNELRILHTCLEHKGRVVSRELLMKRLWETDSFVDENTLTVNISRLRKKLESIGLSGFISTRAGLGYIIEDN
ncbi:MAG: response regulator transcription factor [Ruminococcus sp.]|nr:response regulator transcription factor [Ruminococcus sp.]